MAIPDYQTLMLPALAILGDRNEWRNRDIREKLAKQFELSGEELDQLLPSGKQTTFANRVAWALVYLQKAGLADRPKRGYSQITQKGVEILVRNPERIDRKFLMQFPDFREFQSIKKENKVTEKEEDGTATETPEELLEAGYHRITSELASDLLDMIKKCSPEFFERLVIRLLLKMGYGGSRLEAGKRIGGSGDGGVDGIINEDKLGLDIIYIQAKRWDNTIVGRPEIQKFVGALHGKRAKKGIFITTSSFSNEAREYASNIDNRVVLVDGDQMAGYMIDHNVGVSTVETYEDKENQ